MIELATLVCSTEEDSCPSALMLTPIPLIHLRRSFALARKVAEEVSGVPRLLDPNGGSSMRIRSRESTLTESW